MLTDLDFEKQLEEFGDDQINLLKFLARQQYQTQKLCPIHSKKIEKLESRHRKELGTTGGIGAMIGVAIASAIDYLWRR